MMISSAEMYRLMQRSAKHEKRFDAAIGTPKIWSFYRELYADLMPEIMEGHFDPYPVDWTRVFTPIEYMAWQDIRGSGLDFYPQFPVGKVFVDFADPIKRIAIELDGKQYHEKERDVERDKKLWAVGWRVFRIPGRESFGSDFYPWSDEHQEMRRDEPEKYRQRLERWLTATSDGFFFSLKYFYYESQEPTHVEPSLIRKVLDAHRYVEFPLEIMEETGLSYRRIH